MWFCVCVCARTSVAYYIHLRASVYLSSVNNMHTFTAHSARNRYLVEVTDNICRGKAARCMRLCQLGRHGNGITDPEVLIDGQ